MMHANVKMRKICLGGQWVARQQMLEVLDPADQRCLQTVSMANAEDMLQAIALAKEGLPIAAGLPVHERMGILHRTAEYIDRHHEEFAQTIAAEGSKTITEARSEVTRCMHTLRLSAEEARRIQGETLPFDQVPGGEHRVGYYYRFPIGIIGAITPFNDPLNLVAHKVGPALAAGCPIIIKPASETPLSALLLAEALYESGLPQKLLSVLPGKGREVGETLVTHPDVAMISFTGGLETGRKISHQAGLKKLSMELGSNSPVIVLEDADLDQAVTSTIDGAFAAAGQNCLGVQRIYIEQEKYAAFETRFVSLARQLITGDKLDEKTDMGPLINEKEAKRVQEWVQEALDAGATCLCGGKRHGAFYTPTVLKDVPGSCTLAQEEVFGPVVVLYAVKNVDEAIQKANNVNYGLQAGIFTRDVNVAFQAIHQLNVGGVIINDSSDFRVDAMPFGGVKGSGLGREGVKYAIQDMTEPKVVSIKLSP